MGTITKLSDWLLLLAILVFFSYSDLRSREISNLIIIPIIGFAVYEQRVIQTVAFLIAAVLLGLYDFRQNRFLGEYDEKAFKQGRTHTLYRGGDAKLMTMTVAASPLGIAGVGVSWGFVAAFRAISGMKGALPYAPFLLAGATVTFLLAYLCAKML